MGNKMWLSMLLDPRNLGSDKSPARPDERTYVSGCEIPHLLDMYLIVDTHVMVN